MLLNFLETPGTVAHWEVEARGSQVQDYPQLYREFKASLGFMSPCLKTTKVYLEKKKYDFIWLTLFFESYYHTLRYIITHFTGLEVASMTVLLVCLYCSAQSVWHWDSGYTKVISDEVQCVRVCMCVCNVSFPKVHFSGRSENEYISVWQVNNLNQFCICLWKLCHCLYQACSCPWKRLHLDQVFNRTFTSVLLLGV